MNKLWLQHPIQNRHCLAFSYNDLTYFVISAHRWILHGERWITRRLSKDSARRPRHRERARPRFSEISTHRWQWRKGRKLLPGGTQYCKPKDRIYVVFFAKGVYRLLDMSLPEHVGWRPFQWELSGCEFDTILFHVPRSGKMAPVNWIWYSNVGH